MSDRISSLIDKFVRGTGSDLYLVCGSSPSARVNQQLQKLDNDPITPEDVEAFIADHFPPDAQEEFDKSMEYNTSLSWDNDTARLRINLYRQRQMPCAVIRKLTTSIPSLEDLGLPEQYGDLVMMKRGLVLVVGPTGSGKSTSLAAMIGHRNRRGSGHIITIEDPVEYIHTHEKCIISQRDVGIDTISYEKALKNTLRQAPEVILIGEIRDRETMEHAISFAETGHLVLGTLHANSANQTLERILNFFPQEKHKQILLNLALNLRGVISQRLVNNGKGGKCLAMEIMLVEGLIKDLIEQGKTKEIKDCIEKSRDQGMITFDQCLYDLTADGTITQEAALKESDNPANLRLRFKQEEVAAKMNLAKNSNETGI